MVPTPSSSESPPESWAAYWERKNRELDLLCAHLGEPPGSRVTSVERLMQRKMLLRSRMLARFMTEHPYLTESNLPGTSVELDGAAIDFSYQRYDMVVRKRPFASWLYPGLAGARLASTGALAASGMSALCAVLTAIDLSIGPGSKLYVAGDTYYETKHFVRSYLYQLALAFELPDELSCNAVLLLDSISQQDPLERVGARRLDVLRAVIFDTTCYDVGAPEIERVVARCAAEGVLCILVRSHMKIDTLALEYGRLGSIVFALPRPCSGGVAFTAQRLRHRVNDWLQKTGAGFSLHTYFPLNSDATFRSLNAERNARMRHNNLRAAAALAERVHPRSAARLRPYHHGCFFFFQPARPDASPAFAGRLRDTLLSAGLYSRTAPSFAYDFLAILRLTGDQYQTEGGLRVSIPDYPAEAVEHLIDVLGQFAVEATPSP